jgi:thiosulfate/3-mercaptopyruvate sulfurtransferase
MKIRALIPGFIALLLWSNASWAISLVEGEWLKANLDKKNIRIVDVSNKADTYEKGHIPGAVKVNRYLDLSNTSVAPTNHYPTKEQFEKLMAWLGIDKDTTVVAYDDRYGLFASRFLVIMELYGHDADKLKLLNGGSVRWKALGLPFSKEPAAVRNTRYKADVVRLDIFVPWHDIYRDVVLGDKPEILLLDSRPASEYAGKDIRSIRGGHIPKSTNVTGTDSNNKEDHTFKPREEIQKMYEAKGFTPDRAIYEYCHSGDRSAHAYVVLKHLLGYKNVRFNDGGWAEWASILTLPVEGQVWAWEATKEEKK